jgi:putative flippase GtrA
VRRFLRFAVVGASSTLLDMGIFTGIVNGFGWQTGALRVLANTISFTIGVTNGFIWNRLWAFGATEGHAPTQYARFFLVNLVGWALDTAIVLLAFAVASHLVPAKWLPVVAKAVAIPPVALWNFIAHSLWTFAPSSIRGGQKRGRDESPHS